MRWICLQPFNIIIGFFWAGSTTNFKCHFRLCIMSGDKYKLWSDNYIVACHEVGDTVT